MIDDPFEKRAELSLPLHDGTEDKVSIIIVNRNKPHYLNQCLQSIVIASVNHNYEIIVVDNGSDSETQDFLDKIEEHVTVVRNDKNLFWGPAANRGAHAASKDSNYFIFLHSDVIVLDPRWIEHLISVTRTHKGTGMVGVQLSPFKYQGQQIDYVSEWCMLLSRECWENMGNFSEKVPQIGVGFLATMQAQFKGFKPQVIRHPLCHHCQIFNLDVNDYELLKERAAEDIPKIMRQLQGITV